MKISVRILIVAELATFALLGVACKTDDGTPASTPATPTVNADPVAQTCKDFTRFNDEFTTLSDQERQALINTMSASAAKTENLDLMRGVVDLGDGYLQKDQTKMTKGIRTLAARCAGGGPTTPDTTATTTATTATRRPTPTPEKAEATAAGPARTRTPSELVGRWQGGAGDAFWYTFTASGTFTMENSQTGIKFAGYSRVAGRKITLYGMDGRVFIETRTWSVESTEVFGEAIHTLLLDSDSYVKDEYYK